MRFDDHGGQSGGSGGGGGGGLRRAGATGDVVSRRRGGAPEPIDEGPSQADLDRLNGATQTCPECGKEVFADSELCYHCGAAFAERPAPRTPMWAVVTAGVLLAAFIAALVLRTF